jgi:hypothetical protein
MKTPEMLVGCVCGAVPRNEKFPKGKVAVARCGRVGEPGDCPADACARWEGRRYRHEP